MDSVARHYNSQTTVHVGYAITVSAVVVTVLLALFSFTEQIIGDWVLTYIRPDARFLARILQTITTLPFFVYLFTEYFFGLWPWPRFLSFKYLWGRIQFYSALSYIVSEHMGIAFGAENVDLFYKLKERAVGKKGMGINQAITSLFEARLSVSLWHRRHPTVRLDGDPSKLSDELRELKKQLQIELESTKPFAGIDASVCDVSSLYYAQPAPLLRSWNLADLLHLAYLPTLEKDFGGSREIVERLGEKVVAKSSAQATAASHCSR